MNVRADTAARAWLWAEYLVQCGDEDAVAAAVEEAEVLATELIEPGRPDRPRSERPSVYHEDRGRRLTSTRDVAFEVA